MADSVEYKIQASKTVHGINLREMLMKRPDLALSVDSENFTFLFLLGLLTNLNDGKPDNFIARLHSSRKYVSHFLFQFTSKSRRDSRN